MLFEKVQLNITARAPPRFPGIIAYNLFTKLRNFRSCSHLGVQSYPEDWKKINTINIKMKTANRNGILKEKIKKTLENSGSFLIFKITKKFSKQNGIYYQEVDKAS